MINKLVSNQAFIRELFTQRATITQIQSIDITGEHVRGGRITSLNGGTVINLQDGWIDTNQEGVGIRNQFPGRPLQYLVFGTGEISGVPSAYTALMSNRNGIVGMEHTSAGIQIWNGRKGSNVQTAITFYGKTMDFIPSSQGGGVSLNTETKSLGTLESLFVKDIYLLNYGNYKLKDVLNDIYRNIQQLHNVKESSVSYHWTTIGLQ